MRVNLPGSHTIKRKLPRQKIRTHLVLISARISKLVLHIQVSYEEFNVVLLSDVMLVGYMKK